MRTLIVAAMILSAGALLGSAASAHGDKPHPKCKKGYVVTDDHRCVKAP